MFITKGRCHAKQSSISGIAVFLFTVLLLLQAGSAWAWNPNYRLCFPDVINTPGTYRQPPVIDGVIAGDNGWTSAWRYAFNNGTFVHDAAIQAIKDANYLYLSFEVNHDQELNLEDVIVITIDPTGADADRRNLQIFPVVPGSAATPVPVYYGQGYPWSDPTGTPPPADTEAVASVSGADTNWSWVVELKIPRAAFGIPATGDFGVYINIMPVNGPTTGPTGIATEYPWPLDTPELTIDLLNTPDVSTWGTATAETSTCNGVFITPSDIYTENAPPNRISLNNPNIFHATVHNTSIDNTGAYIPVNGINATFKIANFGLSNMWMPVPATAPSTNPTPTTIINANSTADLTTSWTLSAQEQTDYTARPHQCILVELDSSPSSPPWATVFTNRSAWTNMNFATTSVFESAPEVDPRGWGVSRRGRPTMLELSVSKQIDQVDREDALQAAEAPRGRSGEHRPERRGKGRWADLAELDNFPAEQNDHWQEYKEKLNSRSTQVSQLTYLVHGCAQTGKRVTVRGNGFTLCKRTGSYGYVLRHAGSGRAKWTYDLKGPGVTPVQGKEGRYRVSLKNPLKLSHRFEAKDGPRNRAEMLLDWSNNNRSPVAGGLAAAGAGIYLLRRRKKTP